MKGLVERDCKACAADASLLSLEQQEELGREIPDWVTLKEGRLSREYRFNSYLKAAQWVQDIAEIAEREEHHPDVHLFFDKLLIEIWTHSINGLSEKDYILAAKLDQSFAAAELSGQAPLL